MKKPQKSKSGTKTGTGAEKPARAQRHAKKTTKPVVIDLEAQTVKSEPSATKTTETAKKTSVPKSATQKPEPIATEEASKPKRETPQSGPDKNTKSGTRGGGLIAAMIGGLVALGGAALLQYSGLLPSFGNRASDYVSTKMLEDTNSSFAAKITELEQKLATTSSPAENIDEKIGAKVSELKASLETQADTGASTQLTEKIAQLETNLSRTAEELGSLRDAVKSGDAGDSVALAALKEQIATLSSGLEAASSAPENEKTTQALDALQTALPALKATLDNQVGAIGGKISSLEETTTQLTDQAAGNAGLSKKLNSLTGTVTKLGAKISEQQSVLAGLVEHSKNGADKKTARALAAAALKSRIDRGIPFGDTLKTLKSVAGEVDLSTLDQHAEKGIPTNASIVRNFNSVRDEILVSLTPENKDNALARLLSGAKGLVKVKPLDAVEGDGPDAILSRIGAALQRNDLAKASTEWATLPEKGKEVSNSWHNDLEARMKANTLLAETVQTFLVSQ